MTSYPQHVLLTGATGILGSHILYELLRSYLYGGEKGKITLIVRSKGQESARLRVRKILQNPYKPQALNIFTTDHLLQFIEIIDAELHELNESHLAGLDKKGGLYIIHSAAYTNLSVNDNVYDDLYHHNYKGTMHLLQWASGVARKFIFIGSAYSTGHREGIIPDHYKQLTPDGKRAGPASLPWRNPYEKLKAETGYAIIRYCSAHDIKWQILRPTTICGRIMDAPLYYSPKYNVFYLFGRFFLKMAKPGNRNEVVRIVANPDSVLNVVPVDYIAKAITRVFGNDEIKELNLAYSNSLPVDYIVSYMIGHAGLKSKIVDKIPEDLSILEKMYYKIVGPQFTEYIHTPWHKFDTAVLRQVMEDIPEVNMQKAFPKLYGYAVEQEFGAEMQL
jgi:nucleoside-diphosphate-sugar epimerase